MGDFGERLRMCREMQGISQSELADMCKLQNTHINHFETGRREPNLKNLVKIRNALRVPYAMLLGEEK